MGAIVTATAVSIPFGQIRDVATRLMHGVGASPVVAETTAASLAMAELWGITSHGLYRLPYYLRRMTRGGISPAAEMTMVVDTGSCAIFDGNAGMGHWHVSQAVATAVERAADVGIAAAGVRNSNHCGALGTYALPIIDSGSYALLLSNGPAAMPPWGGRSPVVSTSPLAFVARLDDESHLIVDMSSSAAARGKVMEMAGRGEALPAGWALDEMGQPTTDPARALSGMVAPLGGAKGYALALMIETLTGVMLGPSLSLDVPDLFDPESDRTPQEVSHMVVAFSPALLTPGRDRSQRGHRLRIEIEQAGGRLPGDRRPVAYPDDETLVEVDGTTWNDIQDLETVLSAERDDVGAAEPAKRRFAVGDAGRVED